MKNRKNKNNGFVNLINAALEAAINTTIIMQEVRTEEAKRRLQRLQPTHIGKHWRRSQDQDPMISGIHPRKQQRLHSRQNTQKPIASLTKLPVAASLLNRNGQM